MATKLEKLGADLERARARLETYQKKVSDLEARYREEENLVIQGMVHAANLNPEQLKKVLELAEKGIVGVYPDGVKESREEENQDES